jgi:hypothetical protein
MTSKELREASGNYYQPLPGCEEGEGGVTRRLAVDAAARDETSAQQRQLVETQAALREVTAQRDALAAACRMAVATTGGSQYWNGETHDFLVAMEDAIAQVQGHS